MSVRSAQPHSLGVVPESALRLGSLQASPYHGGLGRRSLAASIALLINALMLSALTIRPAWHPATARTAAVQAEILAPPDQPAVQTPPAPALGAAVRMHLVFEVPQVHIDVPSPDRPVSGEAPASPPVSAAADAGLAQAPAAPQQLTGDLALYCPDRRAPAYPAEARVAREHGEVLLRVGIDEAGRVSEVQIARSSGFPHLDEAARRAVMSWRCQPPRLDGRSVRAVALQPIEFQARTH